MREIEIDQKDILIKEYESWMLPYIAEIHKNEHGGTTEEKKVMFQKGFFDEYFNEKHLVLVAFAGDAVVGTQTYKYWPYVFGDKHYYSVQSGATLVDEQYRGRGIFTKMLESGNVLLRSRMVDFIMGFPVAMSYGGFIKDKWLHLGSPRWFIKPIKHFNVIKRTFQAKAAHDVLNEFNKPPEWARDFTRFDALDRIHLESHAAYLRYRYSDKTDHLFFVFNAGGVTFIFICKLKVTNGFLEIVIGDILTDVGCTDYSKLYQAIDSFIKEIKRLNVFDAISILINSAMTRFAIGLIAHLFIPIWRTVRFIVKPLNEQTNHEIFSDYKLWHLMSADIDNW